MFGLTSRPDFVVHCQRAEELGYDTLFAADHLGSTAPFQMLVAAAAATSRLRLGTLVLNVPFWNPALLAREIITADILTEGRLEIGLGSGHMKWEFDEAKIAWEGFGARASKLQEAVEEIRGIFAAGGYEQRRALEEHFGLAPLLPVQKTGFGGYGPPLLLAGTGERVLRIAARNADIVGIAGARQVAGQPPGVLRMCTAGETDDIIRFARAEAAGRADVIEWNVLVQFVSVTGNRLAAAEKFVREQDEPMTADELLDCPFVLLGTVDEIAEQILRNRDRYGFTYYTVHAPFAEEFAPVIARVRALATGR
jgi:probable F420-dependent oxidoreductase